MTLELYIRDQFIESLEIDVSQAQLVEQRERIVWEFAGYLRNRYRKDIMLAKTWEIILVIKSKIGEQTKGHNA